MLLCDKESKLFSVNTKFTCWRWTFFLKNILMDSLVNRLPMHHRMFDGLWNLLHHSFPFLAHFSDFPFVPNYAIHRQQCIHFLFIAMETTWTSSFYLLLITSKSLENRNDLNCAFKPNGWKIKWNPSVLNTLVIHISMSKNTQKLLKMKSLKWKRCQPHSSIDKAPARAFSYLIHHQRKESLSPGMDLTAQTSIGKKMFLSPTAVSQPNKVNAPWDGRSKINRAVTLHIGSCCPENVPK